MNLRKTAKFSGITELTEMFEFGGILESAEMFEFGGIVQIWRKFRNLWKKNPFYRILELAEIWNWRKTAASSGILDLAEMFEFGGILNYFLFLLGCFQSWRLARVGQSSGRSVETIGRVDASRSKGGKYEKGSH